MKRFVSMLLSVMMLLVFMAVPAKAAETTSGFDENTEAYIGLTNYGVSISMYGVYFVAGSQETMKIELYSGNELLATAYPSATLSCGGTELTCPFYFNGKVGTSWQQIYNTTFGLANKVPNRVDITIGGETRTFNTYQPENDFSRATWLKYTGSKSPIQPTEQQTQVFANVEPTFMVSIQKVVDFGEIKKSDGYKTSDFKVLVSNAFIEADANIVVKLMSDTIMKNQNGIELPFELIKKDDTTGIIKGSEFCSFNYTTLVEGNGAADYIGHVKCSTDKLTAAGNYSGTMTFKISYEYGNLN